MKPHNLKATFSIDSQAGIFIMKTAPSVTVEDAHAIIAEYANKLNASGLRKVIEDHRDLESDMTITDLYYLPQVYAQCGISKSVRIAIITSRTGFRIPDLDFFETVCQNNGYDAKVFEDEVTARQWLDDEN